LYNIDPTKRGVGTISITTPSGETSDLVAKDAFRSGKIAAYLSLRDDVLPAAQQQIDELAAGLSKALSDKTVAGTPVNTPPAT
ncbi:FlgK family flagellar hook-associated protein, partial [Vibrio parahaemolyticus]